MVLPTHWDRFNVTYDVSQEPAIKGLQTFIAEVKAASPLCRSSSSPYSSPKGFVETTAHEARCRSNHLIDSSNASHP